MKINTFSFLLLLATGFSACDIDVVVPMEETPREIRNFVSLHFPDCDIHQCKKDRDGLSRTYEVALSRGFDLEFNAKFRITEMDSDNRLPDSVIPEKPRNYVAEKFPGVGVRDWELNGLGNQVLELETGQELEFTSEGGFIRQKN
jgi:hypothetical protein